MGVAGQTADSWAVLQPTCAAGLIPWLQPPPAQPVRAHSHVQLEAALASLSLSSLPEEPDVGCCAISCLTYQEALQASLCSVPD